MDEILSVRNLKKYFVSKSLFKQPETVRAVDGVAFSIQKGRTLVLAGESGSGKSTIARLLLGAVRWDSGEIVFNNTAIGDDPSSLKKIRTECQMIYQDPYSSINPRMRVFDVVREPLDIHGIGTPVERRQMVFQALSDVKMNPDDVVSKYPHMLSGGQRQRVAIARAISTRPKLIIADEPVSMLDASVRVGILELMRELQDRDGISFLYITHDLSTARYVGHTLAVMYLGKIVETGPIDQVLSLPRHPYTQALLDSVSDADPNNLNVEKKIRINDPANVDTYEGCRFRARCPYVIEKCRQEPPLEAISEGRSVACFVKIN